MKELQEMIKRLQIENEDLTKKSEKYIAMFNDLREIIFGNRSYDHDLSDVIAWAQTMSDYLKRTEGKTNITVQVLKEENAKLWWMVRIAMKDPHTQTKAIPMDQLREDRHLYEETVKGFLRDLPPFLE